MYQLSQALATGSVKLMDWNSVVNAGMGGELFQNALKATAKEMGVVVKKGVSFRESLQSGWLSSKVLLKTLEKLSKDPALLQAATQVKTFTQLLSTMQESVQSGWAQTWEMIIGNRDQAAALFTSINDGFGNLIGPAETARNKMLAFWNTYGGREALLKALTNVISGLGTILKPIGEAFKEMFPPMTGYQLIKITKSFESLTEKFKIGEETAANLKRTFKGFFAVLSIIGQAVSAVVGGFGDLFKVLLPAGDQFLSLSGSMGDWLVSLNEAIKKGDVFKNFVKEVEDVIGKIVQGVKDAIPAIGGFFKSLGSGDAQGMKEFFQKIGDAFGPVGEKFKEFGENFSGAGDLIQGVIDRIRIRFEPLGKVFEGIKTIFEAVGNWFKNTFTKISDGIKESMPKITKTFDDVKKWINDALSGLGKNIGTPNFDTLSDVINLGLAAAIGIGIKKFIDSLTGIAKEVTGIVGSAKGLLDSISGVFNGVKDALKAWQEDLKSEILLKIAGAIAIIAASLLVLSMIDSAKLQSALLAVTTSIITLFGSMATFEKLMKGGVFDSMGKITWAMIGLAAAVLLFSFAMSKMAQLDWEGLAKGLTGVGVILGMLVGVTKLLEGKTDGLIKAGIGFTLMALAVELLAIAVQKFSTMDVGAMIQGLIGVGVVLAEVALFNKITGDTKDVLKSSIALFALSSSLLLMGTAIARLGAMSLEQIGKGLLTMASSLAAVILAIKFIPTNAIGSGTALLLIAAALLVLAEALKSMGGMSWDGIAKSLVVLAGSLLIIAVAVQFMTSALPGAAALLIISVALLALSTALVAFGNMSWESIGKAMVMLAGTFVVLGLAGLVLAPLTPVLLALGVAMALVGVGMLSMGLGMTLFAAALAALAVSGLAGGKVFVLVVKELIGLIPFLLENIAKGIIAFAGVIRDGMPVIMGAVKAYFEGLIMLIGELLPKLIETVLSTILTLLTKLVEYVPKFVDAGLKIMIGFLEGIGKNISQLVQAGITLVMNFIDGIAKSIPKVIDGAFNLIISFIDGLANAVRKSHERLYNAVENLILAFIEAVESFYNKFMPLGKNLIQGMIDGIKNMATNLVKAAKGVIQGAIDAAKKLLGIKSPSKVFAEMGKYSGQGFINGLKNMAIKVADASESLGRTSVNSMSETIGRISDSLDSNPDMQPTIRPVIDMTDVEKGLATTFGRRRGINVNGAVDQVSNVANGRREATVNNVTNNEDNRKITLENHYTVRSDSDIRKISDGQQRLVERYAAAKGVPVEA
jgi:tape measure domain-containing protein